ncbi:MAG: O-antigen ligase family protein [Vulcanococcus sp.]
MNRALELLDGQRPDATSPLGWRCFQLALLLLPASALLAGLLLFVALILGSRQPAPWWKDRLNWLLAALSLWMVLGCLGASSGWLAWVGLGNWLPFFWAFWGFQPYVATPEARRRMALWLVAGTVPVLATGFGQMVLGWSGPYELLGGAIVWWIHRGGNPPGRLSGLFDYANITAAWLALSWPLVLAAFLQHARRWRSGGAPLALGAISLALVVTQVAEMLLTDSRNGWGALVLAVPIVLGPARWIWLLPLLLLALLPVVLATVPGVPAVIQAPLRELVPQSLWGRLNDFNSHGERPLALTRLSQWATAVGLIGERPWLGWGAAAFSVIYPLRTGHWHGHPHNIGLDLAISHGLPVALGVVGLVLWLLIRAAVKGMVSGALFERAWWAAALVLMALHSTDIPMYDSRINIAGWILLAGLRCRL